jgi:hypothetical protein
LINLGVRNVCFVVVSCSVRSFFSYQSFVQCSIPTHPPRPLNPPTPSSSSTSRANRPVTTLLSNSRPRTMNGSNPRSQVPQSSRTNPLLCRSRCKNQRRWCIEPILFTEPGYAFVKRVSASSSVSVSMSCSASWCWGAWASVSESE